MHRHYQAEFVTGKTTEKICIRVHNIDLRSLVISSAATFKSVGFHFVEIDALVALNLWIRGLPDYFKIRPCITSSSLKMVCWGFEFVECFAFMRFDQEDLNKILCFAYQIASGHRSESRVH